MTFFLIKCKRIQQKNNCRCLQYSNHFFRKCC